MTQNENWIKSETTKEVKLQKCYKKIVKKGVKEQKTEKFLFEKIKFCILR